MPKFLENGPLLNYLMCKTWNIPKVCQPKFLESGPAGIRALAGLARVLTHLLVAQQALSLSFSTLLEPLIA
jgi:hypothetical protein